MVARWPQQGATEGCGAGDKLLLAFLDSSLCPQVSKDCVLTQSASCSSYFSAWHAVSSEHLTSPSKLKYEAGVHTYISFFHSRVVFLSRAKPYRGQCQNLTSPMPPTPVHTGRPMRTAYAQGFWLRQYRGLGAGGDEMSQEGTERSLVG